MQIRTKIVLLVVPLMLLPVAALTTLASQYLNDNLRREHRERITALSTQAQYAADLRERQAATTLNLYAENPIVRSFLLDDTATRYSLYEKPLLRFTRSILRAYVVIQDLQVVMPDGTVDFSAADAFAVGVKAGYADQLRQSPGYLNRLLVTENGNAYQVFAMPMYLRNEATEPESAVAAFRGYLVLRLDVLQMYGHVLGGADEEAHMYLLDAATGALIPGQADAENLPEKGVLRALLQRAAKTGWIEPEQMANGDLVVARKLSGDIYLLAVHTDEQLVGSLAQLQRLSWLASLLIISAMLIALMFGLNVLLLRRLRYLDEQIRLAEAGGEIGSPDSVAGTDELSDVTRLYLRAQRQLNEVTRNMAEMAFSDRLTGLPNKVSLQESVAKAIALAKRHNELLAVMFLDLDNFKNVNDALGHEAGDQLLKTVAERLSGCVRSYDVVASSAKQHNPKRRPEDSESMLARLGGDEFSILLNELATAGDCTQIAERIIEVLARPITVGDGHEVFVGTSIGIAVFPGDGDTPSGLLRHADAAMYRAKAAGKNTYRYFDSSMNESARERLEIEADMRTALSAGHFELHYQPKVYLRGHWRYCEFEALLRWRHPQKGMISPDKFIPFAEANGFIRNIGDWVMMEAARQVRAWNDSGFGNCRVSVNLSPAQVSFGSPLTGLLKALGEFGLPAEQIEVEITESGLIRNEEQAIELLNSFREMGVRIALDDFGTGYSSLSYLRKLPIDALKVDRSFVRDLVLDGESEMVLDAIVDLARKLKLLVVAEGVETEEQLEILRRLGVDMVQGYYYAKPMPAAQAREFLEMYQDGGVHVSDIRAGGL